MNRVVFKSESVDHPTPKDLYEKLDREFGFDLDPCPLFGITSGIDGLMVSWFGRRVFCNPPYGPNVDRWLARAMDAAIAVYLLPARTDTEWFHELVLPIAKEIRFIRGRLKFGDAENSAPFPSMIVVFESARHWEK